MAERNQRNRFRCIVVGCNPVLIGQQSATEHGELTGHRTAKWPIRSAAGKAKARQRNRTGYYDQYNVGAKSAVMRGIVRFADDDDGYADHPFSPEALGQD